MLADRKRAIFAHLLDHRHRVASGQLDRDFLRSFSRGDFLKRFPRDGTHHRTARRRDRSAHPGAARRCRTAHQPAAPHADNRGPPTHLHFAHRHDISRLDTHRSTDMRAVINGSATGKLAACTEAEGSEHADQGESVRVHVKRDYEVGRRCHSKVSPGIAAEEQPQRIQANHQCASLMRRDPDGQRHRAERRRGHHDHHHAKRDR